MTRKSRKPEATKEVDYNPAVGGVPYFQAW